VTGATGASPGPRGTGGVRPPTVGRRVLQAVALLLPVAGFGWLGWEQRWVAEDAFIDLRIVQQILAGHGPVYNLGERVEAYTNPLWVALLALLAAPAKLVPMAGPAGGERPWGTAPLEWIAVWGGLVPAVGGLLAAEVGAVRLARRLGLEGFALPLGAVLFAAVPAGWDYVTSGLETGLTLGWLGLTFLCLCLIPPGGRPSRRRLGGAAVLAGLGPLIRPDLAVFGGAFLLVLLLRAGWRPRLLGGVLLAGSAVPLAYQIFRMGYFGALVPNTALAKEAGMAYWAQGWRYFVDFGGAYALWLPLVPVLLWGLVPLSTALRRPPGSPGSPEWRSEALVLLLLPPAAALLHALYIVRVGGDFMHGRLLLPSLFGLLLPLAAAAGRRWWQPVLPLAALLPWAVVAGLWLRPPYFDAGPDPPQSVGRQGIADERGFYVRLSRRAHPVTLADYGDASWTRDGQTLRRRAGGAAEGGTGDGERGLLTWQAAAKGEPDAVGGAPLRPLAPDVPPPVAVVAVRHNIGLTGYAAGPRVHIVDRLGLGDPVAARLYLARRGRPGHEKELPDVWAVARFGAPGPEDEPAAAAARAALACGDLGALLAAVTAPLDGGRFRENVRDAPRLTALRLPADPQTARARLCA
jgi:arabinofuranosyltransferase